MKLPIDFRGGKIDVMGVRPTYRGDMPPVQKFIADEYYDVISRNGLDLSHPFQEGDVFEVELFFTKDDPGEKYYETTLYAYRYIDPEDMGNISSDQQDELVKKVVNDGIEVLKKAVEIKANKGKW